MRTAFIILLLVVIALFVAGLTSCATTRTIVRAPDGTETVTESSAPAIKDNTKQFIADAFWAFAPRQRPVPPPAPAEPKKVDPSK